MIDFRIGRVIVAAQIDSDVGKHLDTELAYVKDKTEEYIKNILGETDRYWIRNTGNYEYKDKLIRSAIKRIDFIGPKSGFSYYIGDSDISGSKIVYFSFKLNGERYQISFHSFSDFVYSQYRKTKNENHKMHWETKHSSREAAIVLDEYLRQIQKTKKKKSTV